MDSKDKTCQVKNMKHHCTHESRFRRPFEYIIICLLIFSLHIFPMNTSYMLIKTITIGCGKITLGAFEIFDFFMDSFHVTSQVSFQQCLERTQRAIELLLFSVWHHVGIEIVYAFGNKTALATFHFFLLVHLQMALAVVLGNHSWCNENVFNPLYVLPQLAE